MPEMLEKGQDGKGGDPLYELCPVWMTSPATDGSAAATRDRFASFQRGIREGRAAASGDEPADAERDDNSR